LDTKEIESRYGALSSSSCSLSCRAGGGAVELAGIKNGEFCIDLGCGRGSDVLKMALKTGPEGFVCGIDISHEMIDAAQAAMKKMNISNTGFIRSDLEKIELEGNKADVIISDCVLNHISDKNAVWKEIYRLLKTEGRFIISDVFSLNDVPHEYSSDPVAVSECWAGAVTKEKYLEVIRNAGFKDITILEESEPYKKGGIEIASFTIKGVKELLR
jgi:arsenite methyltransferase